ncbi:hypothetical protein [Bacillus piscicola]|uniref:hypothetical protein n=1 Tax=Bacillus piscicola TaxID=1632684 RepID=UPI001F09BF64|nr:hypothetical protein [Bacillus piscicola]
MEKNKRERKLEMLLWSIALPGFGQLLQKKYIKGFILVVLEFIVNVKGNLNQVIIFSFQGRIPAAIQETNFLWLMFYPCLYLFAIWDAYKDAGGGDKPFAFLPFVFTAYLTTIALVYSSVFTVNGYLIGPVWLPLISMPLGFLIGTALRLLVIKFIPN